MRGECVGPTGVKFYEGAEVRPGQPLWRVQYAPLRQCVRTHGQANRLAGEREGRLSRLTPTLLTKSVNDVQGECRQVSFFSIITGSLLVVVCLAF